MIEISNLKFTYSQNSRPALDGITLKIPKGKYVAVLGHNGSGKTTLSKILVGLYQPNDGYVKIDGIQINRENLRKIRSKIGIVFQNPENQFVGATVEDDIAFGLENKRLKRSEMRELVIKYAKKVKMDNMLDKEPHSLSGGQKQRVAIASTLALNPDIIIFDEVTSMLDPKGNREVIEIIKEIQKDKQKTLISITHNMEEAILADFIIVLAGGKVIAHGHPSAILSNKEITAKAKIEAPFVYKVSSALKNLNISPTYDYQELIGEICK